MNCTECFNDLDYFTQETFNDDDVLFITESSVPNVCHCFLLTSLYKWVFDSEIPLENPDYKNTKKNPIDNLPFSANDLLRLHNNYSQYYNNNNKFRHQTYRKLKKLVFPSDFTEEDKKEFYSGVSGLRDNPDIGLDEALETYIKYKKAKTSQKPKKKILEKEEIKEFLKGVKVIQRSGLSFADSIKAYVEDMEQLYDEDNSELERIRKIANYLLELEYEE